MGVCTGCGEQLPDGARFCPACGSAASEDRRREAPAERRTVTVLFADAVGSTAFTERAGDEATYRLIQDCTALMVDAVERHHGVVTQFRGDGIMALFGAPVAIERSAVEAVSAALELRDALAAYGERHAGTGSPSCAFRIGLSTGPVVVGRVGDDVLLDYTAIGDTANVAARMEQAADPGTVLIADTTWRAVRSFVEARPVGELDVKGKAIPVAAHQALRRRQVSTRLAAAMERGLGPFVGRSVQLAALLDRARSLSTGTGRVIEIVGEAGIGKSRLLLELRRNLPDEVRWSEGQCSPGTESPYLPIASLLRDAFAIDEKDDPDEAVARVDAATAGWPDAARSAVPYLKYVLDLDPGDPTVAETDARTRRAAILEALQLGLAEAATTGPRAVVIEDIHWAEPAALEALDALAQVAAGAPVLLITTSRPVGASPFSIAVERFVLEGLADGAAVDLAASTLDDAGALHPDAAALVVAKADGNPLFVEELTAAMVETGLLAREGASWALTRPIDYIDVPGTVQEVILARVDRLAREARDALQLAAVIGREFTVRLLDRLAGQADRLDATLDELKAVELIRQKSQYPELAYLFKHAITHEVTYATLLDTRRRGLHRLVAQAIEEVYADRLQEHVEALAHHWFEAEVWQSAMDYLGRAGDAAAATFSNEIAAAFFEQGYTAAERLDDAAAAVSFASRIGEAFMSLGDLEAAGEAYGRMEAMARRAGDVEAEAWALTLHGEADAYRHDFESGEALLRAAIALPGISPSVRLYATAFLHLYMVVFGRHHEAAELEALVDEHRAAGPIEPRTAFAVANTKATVLRWRGQLPAAVEIAAQAAPSGTDLLTRQTMSWWYGMSLGEIGRYDEAFATLEGTIERSTRASETMIRARSLNTIGWLRGDLGDHAGSVAWNERCLAFLQEVEIPDEEIESNARLNLADAYLATGQVDLAEVHLDRVADIVRGKPIRDTWGLWRYGQHHLVTTTRLLLATGRIGEIGGRLDDCEALAMESHSLKYQGKVARIRAELLHAAGEADGAHDLAELAAQVAADVGHPPEQWRAALLLANIAMSRGDPDAAEHHRSAARSMVAEVAAGLVDPAGRAGLARLLTAS